jgi:hypothetical protein
MTNNMQNNDLLQWETPQLYKESWLNTLDHKNTNDDEITVASGPTAHS